MSHKKNLKYQIKQKLSVMCCYGKSKHKAKASEGQHPKGIYSIGTYNAYNACCQRFGQWAKEKCGVHDLNALKGQIDAYMGYRVNYVSKDGKHLSAWTLKQDRAAIEKLFEDDGVKVGVELPERKRSDIKKNRGSVIGFDEKRHILLSEFGKATGLRRRCLTQLRYADIDDVNGTIYVKNGKGGKSRTVHALNSDILRIIKAGRSDYALAFESIPCRFPEHRFRREYAQTLYKRLERPINEIPRSERYCCRGDGKGRVFDRVAMLAVSKELGHNRVNVIAEHYLI